jgi:hypothetical protein
MVGFSKAEQLPTLDIVYGGFAYYILDITISNGVWPEGSPDQNRFDFSYGVVGRAKFSTVTP